MAVVSDTSKVNAAIVALLAALDAEQTLLAAGVQVTDGIPGQPQDELIAVRGVADWDQQWHGIASGLRPKEETFSIQLYIRVLRGQGSNAAARARAFALLEVVEDMLRNDPEITNTVWVAGLSRGEYVNANSGKHAEAQLSMLIECKARI